MKEILCMFALCLFSAPCRADQHRLEDMVINGINYYSGGQMPVSVKRGESRSFDNLFIAGIGETAVDGDAWSGRVWPRRAVHLHEFDGR